MNERVGILRVNVLWIAILFCVIAVMPEFALAQAADPFETGATSLQTSLTAIATPIAVILIMALGVAALDKSLHLSDLTACIVLTFAGLAGYVALCWLLDISRIRERFKYGLTFFRSKFANMDAG